MSNNNKNKKKKKYLIILAALLLSGALVGSATAIICTQSKNNVNSKSYRPTKDIELLEKFKKLKIELEEYKTSLTESNISNNDEVSNLIEEVENIIETYSNKQTLSTENKDFLNKKYDEFIKSFNNLKYKNNKSNLNNKIEKTKNEISNFDNTNVNDASALNDIVNNLSKIEEEFNKLPEKNINNDSKINQKIDELNNEINQLIKELDLIKNNSNAATTQEDLENEKSISSIVIKDSSSLEQPSSLTTKDFEVVTSNKKNDKFIYEVAKVNVDNEMLKVIVEAQIRAKDNDKLIPVIITKEFNLDKNNSKSEIDKLKDILKNATINIEYVGKKDKKEIFLPEFSSEEVKEMFEIKGAPVDKITNKVIENVISSIVSVETKNDTAELTVLIKSLIYPEISTTIKVTQSGFKNNSENIVDPTNDNDNSSEKGESSDLADTNKSDNDLDNSDNSIIENRDESGTSDSDAEIDSSKTTDQDDNNSENSETNPDNPATPEENNAENSESNPEKPVVPEETPSNPEKNNDENSENIDKSEESESKNESEGSNEETTQTTDQNNSGSAAENENKDNEQNEKSPKSILEEAVRKINNLTVIRFQFWDETNQNLADAKNILAQESPSLDSITSQTDSINQLIDRIEQKEDGINEAAAQYNEVLGEYNSYIQEYQNNPKAIWEINQILSETKRQYKLSINNPYLTVEKINELKDYLSKAKEKIIKKQTLVEKYAKEIVKSYEFWVNYINSETSDLHLNELQTFELIKNHFESINQEYSQLFSTGNLTKIQDVIDLEFKGSILTLNYEVKDIIKIENLMYIIKNDSDYLSASGQTYRNTLDKTMFKLETLINKEIDKLSNSRFNTEEGEPSYSYYFEKLTNEFNQFKNNVSKNNQ